MKINQIKASKYSIIIGRNSISLLSKELKKLCPKCQKVAIIIDRKYQKNF